MDKLKLLLWIALIGAVGWSVKSCADASRAWSDWSADTTRLFTQLEVDRLISDSLKVQSLRSDSLVGRLTERAHRLQVSLSASRRVGDSLYGVLSASSDSAISRSEALQALESYRVALGEAQERSAVLEAIVAAQKSQIVQLSRSDSLGWRGVDSLSALVRRTPKCPRLPLVNLPVPRLGVGFAVTSGGSGVGVALTVPLGKC